MFRRPDGLPYVLPKGDGEHVGRVAYQKGLSRRPSGEPAWPTSSPHILRHTWATWHYAANRDLGALMKLGGWKSTTLAMRYAHVNVGELAHTIDKLPA